MQIAMYCNNHIKITGVKFLLSHCCVHSSVGHDVTVTFDVSMQRTATLHHRMSCEVEPLKSDASIIRHSL